MTGAVAEKSFSPQIVFFFFVKVSARVQDRPRADRCSKPYIF